MLHSPLITQPIVGKENSSNPKRIIYFSPIVINNYLDLLARKQSVCVTLHHWEAVIINTSTRRAFFFH